MERRSHESEVTKWTNKQAGSDRRSHRVRRLGRRRQSLVLPGHCPGMVRGADYARVTGYLKTWYFDYGAHVKKGDVLAEIERAGS